MTGKRMEEIVSFCKERGFFSITSELYGGLPGVFDYGPLGTELKMHFKRAWWRSMVYDRDNVEGLDAAILSHPKLLDYSGHIDAFTDMQVKCRTCRFRMRLDHMDSNRCQHCGSQDLSEPEEFNMMFRTHIGSVEDEAALCFLRPSPAQNAFVNFKKIFEGSDQRLPFGIAQIGKAFRNEIAPNDFPFRMREFEQMELQYFVEPDTSEQWHDRLVNERVEWWVAQGLDRKDIEVRDVPENERAHYSRKTVDIYYRFPGDFFGEIEGIANRGDYDLGCHSSNQASLRISAKVRTNTDSNVTFAVRDPVSEGWIVPFIIEPGAGVDRGMMAVLCEAYTRETLRDGSQRVVLKLKPHLSPIKAAVVAAATDQKVRDKALEIKRRLQALDLGRIVLEKDSEPPRVFARHDEAGTPVCIVVDSGSLASLRCRVHVRDRDTTEITTIPEEDLAAQLSARINASMGSIERVRSSAVLAEATD